MELGLVHLKNRRTRIVATLGPATTKPTVLRRLLAAGVDVVRLNFSHGAASEHRRALALIRRLARDAGRHIPVLADLAGPKIRTGRFRDGAIELVEGEPVTVTTRQTLGEPGLISSQYRRLADDVRAGHRLLLDDGAIELRVDRVRAREIHSTVVRGGLLTDNKGINLPDTEISVPALTSKDRRDAATAISFGVDYLGLSFVRSAADIHTLARLIRKHGAATPIIAKIEKREALDDIEAILAAADAVMVARGDLGVELPQEQVPIVQSELTRLARARNRPVIVATQMLQSMVASSRATRAEVNDVATAAFDGADAVMLSAETAIGRHPLDAVRTMNRVLREVEGYLWTHGAFGGWQATADTVEAGLLHDAIGRATSKLSRDLQVRAIVVPTRTGTSARFVSADRPAAPVLAVCPDDALARRLALLWGAITTVHKGTVTEDVCRDVARRLAKARRGDRVLIVRGFAEDPRRSVPTIAVVTV